MQRRYEFVDLIVAMGLFATIVAGGLLFLAANGTLSLSPSRLDQRAQPVSTLNGLRWLQPVLGQAIVDQDLLERRYEKAGPAAVAHLTGIIGEHRRWQNSPFGYLDSIKLFAAREDADHRTRAQAVMGRAIVNFTGRGIRTGVLFGEQAGSDYNARMIGGTEATGQRIDAQFLVNWQPNLGRAVVVASQDDTSVSALRQERLGAGIVRVTAVQSTYEEAHAWLQEQLGSAVLAAARTELQTRGSERVETSRQSSVTEAEREPWPEIPSVAIVAGSFILLSLFMAGLFIASGLPRVIVRNVGEFGPIVLASSKSV